jgi:hypothetical protein
MTQRRNLKSSLRGRICTDPMREFDRLPAPLRQWVAQAQLPWSARSVRRIWLRHHDTAEALKFLEKAERATLARDTAKIWGKTHPACGRMAKAGMGD